jgi:LacI family transcriptional regulator
VGDWQFYLEPKGENEEISLPKGWSGDGIIARFNSRKLYDEIKSTGLPAVNISGQVLEETDIHRVAPSDYKIISTAYSHLRNIGIDSFAFSGLDRNSEQRLRICREMIESEGHKCNCNFSDGKAEWGERLARTAEWLKSLFKPAGVIAWGTVEGRHIADACKAAELRVPEDIAIIGCDFDELIGEMITPSVTGVSLPTIQQGFEAAKMLHSLMKDEPVEKKEIWLEPLGIIHRESTLYTNFDDKEVTKAVRYIKDNFSGSIEVMDIINACSVSRRTLERRFFKTLGRTPAEEIRRMRIEKAKDLLIKTNMTVQEIASACGWKYVEQMIPSFRQKIGMTPVEFRKKAQSR